MFETIGVKMRRQNPSRISLDPFARAKQIMILLTLIFIASVAEGTLPTFPEDDSLETAIAKLESGDFASGRSDLAELLEQHLIELSKTIKSLEQNSNLERQRYQNLEEKLNLNVPVPENGILESLLFSANGKFFGSLGILYQWMSLEVHIVKLPVPEAVLVTWMQFITEMDVLDAELAARFESTMQLRSRATRYELRTAAERRNLEFTRLKAAFVILTESRPEKRFAELVQPLVADSRVAEQVRQGKEAPRPVHALLGLVTPRRESAKQEPQNKGGRYLPDTEREVPLEWLGEFLQALYGGDVEEVSKFIHSGAYSKAEIQQIVRDSFQHGKDLGLQGKPVISLEDAGVYLLREQDQRIAVVVTEILIRGVESGCFEARWDGVIVPSSSNYQFQIVKLGGQ